MERCFAGNPADNPDNVDSVREHGKRRNRNIRLHNGAPDLNPEVGPILFAGWARRWVACTEWRS
jgi:hypothetical protein